jgi:WD40 repeat protein
MIIVLKGRVCVYSFEKVPRLLYTFESSDNANGIESLAFTIGFCVGICAVSGEMVSDLTIAFPAIQLGNINIVSFGVKDGSINTSLFNYIVIAHKSEIQCLALSRDGKLLASASKKGTLLRIFTISSNYQRMICELRRGSEHATIHDINFSVDSKRICLTSDKGTLHVFSVVKTKKGGGGNLVKDYLKFLNNPQWSLAQGRLVSTKRSICTFSTLDPTVIYGKPGF